MGKEDVEGEGGWGGEVCASGNLRFSKWVWFRRASEEYSCILSDPDRRFASRSSFTARL
jgi:hypothetical protein